MLGKGKCNFEIYSLYFVGNKECLARAIVWRLLSLMPHFHIDYVNIVEHVDCMSSIDYINSVTINFDLVHLINTFLSSSVQFSLPVC